MKPKDGKSQSQNKIPLIKKLTRISFILTFLILLIWIYLYHYLLFSTIIWSVFGGMKGRSSNELETSFVFYADPQIEGSRRIKEQGLYGNCFDI